MKALATLLFAACATAASAQTENTLQRPDGLFNHLDVSFTAGSTGLGFEAAMPVNEYLRLRAGATFMPHFHYNMHFGVQLGDGDQMCEDGTETRFQRMARMLEDFTGQPVDDQILMVGTPNMNQFKFMADVRPFRNKNWYFSAGFYCGKPRVARAINHTSETSSVFAINLYNRLYDTGGEITQGVFLPPEVCNMILSFGRAGFPTGQYTKDEMYYDVDFEEWAVLHAKGDTYLMGANIDNTVFADAFVDKFRPYFGAGYEGAISKDHRWKLGANAGVMFWGGAPQLIDHSGVDLMYDVENIGGQVGNYVEFARNFKAFPVVEVKLVRRLF